jgi:hypothetical protein
VCKINDGRKWSAGSLEIALLGRRVFRGQRFAAIGGWPRTKMAQSRCGCSRERRPDRNHNSEAAGVAEIASVVVPIAIKRQQSEGL